MEKQRFRCLKRPSYSSAWSSGKYQPHNTSELSDPQGTLPHFKESVSIKKWPHWAQRFSLWINLDGEGDLVGRGKNIEVLGLNISKILKAQVNIYLEVVSCLRKGSYMQKCHVNSKEIMLMADNESILFLLYCILVIFISQNCILLPKSPWWRKHWKFLLKRILKL